MEKTPHHQKSETLQTSQAINTHCPWSGDPISEDSLTLYKGMVVGFCNPGCRDRFAKAVSHFESSMEALSLEAKETAK